MAVRKLTAAQLRDRKTKRLAIGLTVVLIGVLGFQAPTIMNLFNGSGGAGGAGSTSAAPNTPVAAPGGVPSGPAAAGAPIAAGQLTNFGAFASKDPFHAPAASLAVTTGSSSTTPSATKTTVPATAQTKTKPTPKPKPKPVAKPVAKPKAAIPLGSPPATVPFTSPAAAPDAALIITNGKRQIVPIGGGFPRAQPLFKLVSLAAHKKAIRIAVLGGSFTNGVATLLVKRDTVLTLANESDGLRYVIKLLRLTTAPTPGVPGAAPVSAAAGSASSG